MQCRVLYTVDRVALEVYVNLVKIVVASGAVQNLPKGGAVASGATTEENNSQSSHVRCAF